VILEEQAHLRRVAIEDARAECRRDEDRRRDELNQAHEALINNMNKQFTKERENVQLAFSKDMVRFQTETDREKRILESKIEDLQDLVDGHADELENEGVYYASLIHDAKTKRIAQVFLRELHAKCSKVKQLEALANITIYAKKQNTLLYFFASLQKNVLEARVRESLKQQVKSQSAVRLQVCDLLSKSKKEAANKELMQLCFNAIAIRVREDDAGIRKFREQKKQTLDAVQTMHQMTAEARLTAEKVRISQDQMLHKVMNFVKTNRANSARSNLI
jgi:hypothetical protein